MSVENAPERSAKVKLIKVKETVLSKSRDLAETLRDELWHTGVILVNIMASPGGGKTSLILGLIERLRAAFRIAVIEADLDSTVDADKIAAVGIPAVQLETGGFCHTSAAMTRSALHNLDLSSLDLIFLENVGNLVCPAQSDCGAHLNIVVLSVPEGDDKPVKYPLIFRVAHGVVLNKVDYLTLADFDTGQFRRSLRVVNRGAPLFEASCRTGEGLDELAAWISQKRTKLFTEDAPANFHAAADTKK